VSGFTRLARTHALLVSGDTLVALALAGSLFFSIDPSAARWRVGLYLLLTMAPFAIVSPLIGPALDRAAGGRRLVVIVSGALRAVVAVLMFRHLDSLFLFPEAFLMLVLGKSYHVAKSAIVPGMVHTDDELVMANSRLSLLSGVAGVVAVAFGGVFIFFGGPRWVCLLCSVVFGVGAVLATRLPRSVVADEPAGEEERAELRGAGIRLAASAMGLLRGIVGFLTFLIAFTLRGSQETPYVEEFGSHVGAATRDAIGQVSTTISTGSPTWYFGVAAAMAGLGAPVGALITPRLRRSVPEERIIVGALVLAMVVGFVAAALGGLAGAGLMAFVVAVSGSAGKLAFDSIVQRDAPDANRGRSFARFEARFQLIWVFGAAIPVIVPIPGRVGYLMIAVVAAFAAASYIVGYRFLEAHGRLRPNRTTERIKAEASRRARRVGRSARTRLSRRDASESGDVDPGEP
jgi:Major Facilitator Superfamily